MLYVSGLSYTNVDRYPRLYPPVEFSSPSGQVYKSVAITDLVAEEVKQNSNYYYLLKTIAGIWDTQHDNPKEKQEFLEYTSYTKLLFASKRKPQI